MNGHVFPLWIFLGAWGLLGCGDADEGRRGSSDAGEGGDEGGKAGAAGLGGSAGSIGGAGASGGAQAGSAGTSGRSGGGGHAGSAGSAGSAGNAGNAGSFAEPLSVELDPSRISELHDCALAQDGSCITSITRTKAEVCARWEADWPKRAPHGYTLPADDCVPAVLEPEAEEDAIRRVNLYRWLSGLGPVTVNDEWSPFAADCSIIQAHLEQVDHFPPSTSTCYTERGAAASAESLLAIGSHTPADSIDDLIWDWGDRNFHVLGHRWWLLHPGLSVLGIGFSLPGDGWRGTCVRTSDGGGIERPEGLAGIVPYPAFGVTPYELISRESYSKPVPDALEWSITFPDTVVLSGATVRAFRDTGSEYAPFEVAAGAFVRDFNGLWIQPNVDPVPPGTYLILVGGTELGEFGYRVRIERCGSDAAPLGCDTVEQDCELAGYGCYGAGAAYCAKSGTLASGEECLGNLPSECAAGSTCVENRQVRDGFMCVDYCDPSLSGATSCDAVCPGGYYVVNDPVTELEIGGYCQPGVGAECEPLAPDCPSGQACYSWEPARCLEPGVLTRGASCEYTNDCEPGLACIGLEGGSPRCNPYCDAAATAGETACAVVCEFDYFTFDGYGICYEE